MNRSASVLFSLSCLMNATATCDDTEKTEPTDGATGKVAEADAKGSSSTEETQEAPEQEVGEDTICLPPDCGEHCCQEDQKCSDDGITCVPKCLSPKPDVCGDICCPNTYDCFCPEEGGICLPGNSSMCDCETFASCFPGQECIGDQQCRENDHWCKPIGGMDCPEAPLCWCSPNYTCTGDTTKPCCPTATPVPCVGNCCLPGETCLHYPVPYNCLSSGEEDCGLVFSGCAITCPMGQQCRKDACECEQVLPDIVCEEGYTCTVAKPECVGKNLGESGCCPKATPIGCADGHCCPLGTHCDPNCVGCVENGYFCCSDGVNKCLDSKICWSNGVEHACLDDVSQHCGSYTCLVSEVCSSGPQKCCPASTPKTCANTCCHEYETCHDGICVDEQAGYEYCGGGYTCNPSWNCVPGKQTCVPEGAVICDSGCWCSAGQCNQLPGDWGEKCLPLGANCGSPEENCWLCCPKDYECRYGSSGCFKNIPQPKCCFMGSPFGPEGSCNSFAACDDAYMIEPIDLNAKPQSICQ